MHGVACLVSIGDEPPGEIKYGLRPTDADLGGDMHGKRPIVQIAGVLDQDDADVLVAAGVTHIGFPLRLDVNAEDISEQDAATVIASLPEAVTPVLITYLSTAGAITALCSSLGCRTVQVHGEIKPDELRQLKQAAAVIAVWKSLVIGKHTEDVLLRQVRAYGPFVDAFITDTYAPETGASGATGQTHDWHISRRLVQASPVPVILAGGLTPSNVADAITTVQPAGVDSHTGVEAANGRNDPARVRAFVQNARQAFGTPPADA